MKKLTALALVSFCVLCLVGCSKPPASSGKTDIDTLLATNKTQPADTVEPKDFSENDAFDISVSYAGWSENNELYIQCLNRDKMMISSIHHIPIYKFDSKDVLEQFKHNFGDDLSMDQGYDEAPSFNEATAEYDDTFFEENTLFLVYVTANSGSLHFDVDRILCEAPFFSIHIKQVNDPEVFTDDMAGWFITVAAPKSIVAGCTEFDADLNSVTDRHF